MRCQVCRKNYSKEFFEVKSVKDGKVKRHKNCPQCRVAMQASAHKITRDWLELYKDGRGCELCDECDPYCLDFHHLDPKNKVASVANMMRFGFSLEAVQAEIEKCLLLCANCHRKVHRRRKKAVKAIKQLESWYTKKDGKKKKHLPKLSCHKRTGRGYVTDPYTRKEVYFGPYGLASTHRDYRRWLMVFHKTRSWDGKEQVHQSLRAPHLMLLQKVASAARVSLQWPGRKQAQTILSGALTELDNFIQCLETFDEQKPAEAITQRKEVATQRIPKLGKHKGSGRGYVTDPFTGREVYLGVHGTPECQTAYDCWTVELIARRQEKTHGQEAAKVVPS